MAAALVVGAAVSPAAADTYSAIHLEAKGCARCEITVHGMVQRWGEWKGFSQTVSLYNGTGTAMVPARFTTLGFLVQDPKRNTGWNSVTTIALTYRGYQPGQGVTNRQSRKAKWAQTCMTISGPETWVTFRVAQNRNPLKWKGKDPTWTKYSLRAWASPQIPGTGLFQDTDRGRASTQNPSCGYQP